MRRTIVRWSIVFGCFLAFATLGYAQNEDIHGQVTDANGKAMPGATVKVVNSATGETAQDTTDKDGNYRIPLRTGSFAVTATATGFGNASQTVDIVQGDTPEVNFKMLTGGESAQVSVTSTASQNAVTEQQVENLPSNGRNQIDLTLQAPRSDANSVVNDVFVSYNASSGGAFQIVMDGQQLTTIIAQGFGQAHFSKDAVEQLQMGDRFDATQGRSTKLIANETTKSGTNQFLGRASGYFRNDFLNSPDYMTINPNTGRYITLPYQDQQLSFTFGGPIIKDKLHFFGNFEYERNPQTYPFNSPFNGQTVNGQTFPNIPDLNENVTSGRNLKTEGGRVDWQLHGQDHLMFRVGVYTEVQPLDYTEYNGTSYGPSSATGINKWDHQYFGVYTKVLSSRSVNIVRAGQAYFQWNEPSQPGVNNPFSSYAGWNGYPSAGIAEGLVGTMGMPIITVSEQATAPAGCSNAVATAAGTCATALSPTGTVVAGVASPVSGYHFGQEHNGSPELLNQTVWSIRDDYSHTGTWYGGHTIKAGAEWLHQESFEVFSSGNAGTATVSFPWALGPALAYYFSGLAGNTGNALPTAAMQASEQAVHGSGIDTPATWNLGGLVNYATADSLGVFGPVPKYNMIRKYYAAYVQDDWQLKRNLTLNYGLRYDIATNLFAEDEYVPGIKNSGIPIAKNGFGPRIGFTYKVTPATILRGGFGKYFADCGMQTCANAGARTGAGPAGASLSYATTIQNKALPGQTPTAGSGLQFPQDLVSIFQSPPPLEGYPTSNVQFIPGATGNAFVPVATGPNGLPSVLAQYCTNDNASGTFSVNAAGNAINPTTECIRPSVPSAGEIGGLNWSDNANIGVEHLMGKAWVLNSDFYFEGGRNLEGGSAGANFLWNQDGTNAPYDNFATVAGTPTLYSLTATTPLAGGAPGAQANNAAAMRVYPNYTTASFASANTISNYLGVTTTLIKRAGAFTGSISHTWSEIRDVTEARYGCVVGNPCVGNGSAEVPSSLNNYVPSGGTPNMVPAFPAGYHVAEGYEGLNYYSYGATDQRNRVNVNFQVRLPHGVSISGLYFYGSGQALAGTFSSSGNATNIAGTTTSLSTIGVVNDSSGSNLFIPNAEAANTLPYNKGVVVINGSIRTDGGVSPSGNPANPNLLPGSSTGLPVSSLCAAASIKLPTVAEDPFAVPACLSVRDAFHPLPIARVDARLTKTIKMGERVTTDVFIEAFNLFNHENFGTWNSTASSNSGASAYGLPSYNYALPFQARMAQFGFKCDFKL